MKPRDSHRKLLALLCLAMVTTTVLLAGCGGMLVPEQAARAPSENTSQMAEAFDQIVPGMTRADDLASLGFDARAANAEILSARDIGQRFGSADPAMRDCVDAGLYCTGFVFHPAAEPSGFQRVVQTERPSGDVVLLVMNGRVMHKVFSASPGGITVARAF